jgi:hypothetical protein
MINTIEMEYEVEIISLGFTQNIVNRTLFYKMIFENNDYLITKDADINFSILNRNNELEVFTFDWQFKNYVDDICRKTPKNQTMLTDVKSHIKQFKIKKVKSDKKTLTSKEINNLFSYMNEMDEEIILSSNDIETLYDHVTEYSDLTLSKKDSIYNECENLIVKLMGYTVDIKHEGSHKTDGQFVDYTLILKSPRNKVTHIDTEMCLMVGWNFSKTIKL